jgi:hypothetical protein
MPPGDERFLVIIDHKNRYGSNWRRIYNEGLCTNTETLSSSRVFF